MTRDDFDRRRYLTGEWLWAAPVQSVHLTQSVQSAQSAQTTQSVQSVQSAQATQSVQFNAL